MDEDLMRVLKAKGRLVVSGKIFDEASAEFKKELVKASASTDEIIIIFDSPGGDLSHVWGIIDYISMVRNVVVGIVVGKCSSAAFDILQACDLRLATPNSRFLIHHIRRSLRISMCMSDEEIRKYFERAYNEARDNDFRMARLAADRSGNDLETIFGLMDMGDKVDQELNSAEALQYNFIDKIVNNESEIETAISEAVKFSR